MEYCFNTNINIWEIFKALTPYIIALFVFFIWHWQKRKEVIANEAKNLSLNIISFKQNYIEVYKDFMFIDNDSFCNGKDKLQELKIEASDIRNQIIYFCILSKTKKDPSIEILDKIIYYMIDKSIQSDWIDRVDNDFHNSFNKTSENIQNIILALSYYTLYKINIPRLQKIDPEIIKLFPKE